MYKIQQTNKIDINGDAKDSRCSGLLDQMALRKENNKRVHADNITKNDGPFYCSQCLSEAVVRKCSEKINHFAHHARHSPIIKKRDQELHNKCRDEICEYLKANYPDGNWATERTIPANTEKDFKEIIPDISGRIAGMPIAIEIQASAYTISRIVTKTKEYNKRQVAVLWIIPLTEDLGEKPFRPRLFEKFLHSMYFGRVYYWTPNCDKVIIPVHFSPAKRWIEESTWYDTELMEERTEGGFYLTYRTIKTPNFGKNVCISENFEKFVREEFIPKNAKKAVPKCVLFKDNLKEWWDKNEYKDVQKQFTIIKEVPKNNYIEKYEYIDDYDDEFYLDQY